MANMTIGFIGQGFIGKAYADDFEKRGYSVVRYAKEEPYAGNKDKIRDCEFVWIAVPTPTTPSGFDYSIVEDVLRLVGLGKVAVIKSTLLPGTTEMLQEKFPDIIILHSPEFLRARSAAEDVQHPSRNIVGMPKDTPQHQKAAKESLDMMPPAPFSAILKSKESELVKYAGNVFLAMKLIFANMLFDVSAATGADYEAIKNAFGSDPRIGTNHLAIDFEGGRGAGGYCFIKDFAAFNDFYEKMVKDTEGVKALRGFEEKNVKLLRDSGKDAELLRGVYGE
jgi:UDPglucose 6-dehydrogenase